MYSKLVRKWSSEFHSSNVWEFLHAIGQKNSVLSTHPVHNYNVYIVLAPAPMEIQICFIRNAIINTVLYCFTCLDCYKLQFITYNLEWWRKIIEIIWYQLYSRCQQIIIYCTEKPFSVNVPTVLITLYMNACVIISYFSQCFVAITKCPI